MKRGNGWLEALIPLLAVALALLLGAGLILAVGKDPLAALDALWTANFGSRRGFGETLVSFTPLVFTGLSVALAFRCGLFNIGGEGQFLVGGLAAAIAGYGLQGLPGWLHAGAALLAGALAGAVWAGIPGLLKAYRGVHEVVNTIMMNYIALYLVNYLLINFFKREGPLPITPPVAPAARLALILEPSRLTTGLYLALAAAGLIWFLLWRTAPGYEIRAVGLAPFAAEYAGISVPLNTLKAMGLAGALAGLAGAVQVLGVQGAFYDPIGGFVGYGFDGIAVSLLGRNHPIGLLPAAFLFAILDRGSAGMQAMAGIPKAVVWVVQAGVVLLVAADGILRSLLVRRRKGVAA